MYAVVELTETQRRNCPKWWSKGWKDLVSGIYLFLLIGWKTSSFWYCVWCCQQNKDKALSIRSRRLQHQKRPDFPAPVIRPRMGWFGCLTWLCKDWLCCVLSFHHLVKMVCSAAGMVLVPLRPTDRVPTFHPGVCTRLWSYIWENVNRASNWIDGNLEGKYLLQDYYFRRIQVHCYMCNVCELLVQVNGWWFSYLTRNSI